MTSVTDTPTHADLTMVWAEARNGVIGHEGDMPWHVPEDLRHFQQVTSGKTVLMGRRTWESLPVNVRPLKGRRNVILTRDVSFRDLLLTEHADVRVFSSWEEAVVSTAGEQVAVIGGAGLFHAGLGVADTLEVTRLDVTPAGDTFAPVVDEQVWERAVGVYGSGWDVSVSGVRFRFERWVRRDS